MTLLSCIYFYSFLNGVNPLITKAVIAVESSGNSVAVGGKDDSGLMQIRAKYVPETQLQLFNPCTNVKRGTKLLAEAMRRCRHKADLTWINCYNLGVTGGSKLKHPKLWPYYKKVVSKL